MEVGAIIREVRKNNGYTQVELAKKIGIAVNSLRLYEAGKISPPMSVLERLAEVTKTRIQLFLPLGEWKDIFKRLPHGVSEAEFLHSISMEIDAPIGKVESVVSSGEDSLFSQIHSGPHPSRIRIPTPLSWKKGLRPQSFRNLQR